MRPFLIEILFAVIASALCLLYILIPNPYLMAVFVFVVQPMFLFVIVSTLWMIFKDLKERGVL